MKKWKLKDFTERGRANISPKPSPWVPSAQLTAAHWSGGFFPLLCEQTGFVHMSLKDMDTKSPSFGKEIAEFPFHTGFSFGSSLGLSVIWEPFAPST